MRAHASSARGNFYLPHTQTSSRRRVFANHRQGLPAASSRDWWILGEGREPGNSNGRGGPKEAAEATRDGGGYLRYTDPKRSGALWGNASESGLGSLGCQEEFSMVQGRGGRKWESGLLAPGLSPHCFLLTARVNRLVETRPRPNCLV